MRFGLKQSGSLREYPRELLVSTSGEVLYALRYTPPDAWLILASKEMQDDDCLCKEELTAVLVPQTSTKSCAVPLLDELVALR